MDILTELEALKADNVAALGLLQEATASFQSLKAEADAKEIALQAAAELVSIKDKAIADLNLTIGQKDSAYAQLEAQLADLQAAQKSAEAKAVEIVAAHGINPVAVSSVNADKPTTREEAVALYLSAGSPAAKAEVYGQYKALL